jgi:CRISPR system Cascade subunit CasE
MFLHSVQLDLRCREARRDLADAYQMHATLSRAFGSSDPASAASEFLWRLESYTSTQRTPQLLVQARSVADWARVGVAGWLASAAPPLDLRERLGLHRLRPGQRFRFRLRGNPSVMRDGKRRGLLQPEEQQRWLLRKSGLHGFALADIDGTPHVQISQQHLLMARKHDASSIKLYSVLYDGVLTVTDVERFTATLKTGIGHGKALGLGLLSVAPFRGPE